MITGVVNASLDATVRLTIRHATGHEHEFEAIVDTGFNGSLTLPPTVIRQLGLPWRTYGSVMLADGSSEECDIHAATVIWDGADRKILVEAADTEPLVGMALLRGQQLQIAVVPGGRVLIGALS